MPVTVACAVIIMAGLFLLLLAGVGYIQDRRFFSSAPQEVLDVLQDKKERFPGQHVLGWCMGLVAILLMAGGLVLGAVDGIRNSFSFMQFFCRFAIMMLLVKAYDIFFFDWILLCHSHFFSHYYPETKTVLGPHLFGFNKKSHVIQILALVAASAVLAWICTLF